MRSKEPTAPRWRDIPPHYQKVVLERVKGFAEQSLAESRGNENFLEKLMISCYSQGVADTTQVLRGRVEGRYEEER